MPQNVVDNWRTMLEAANGKAQASPQPQSTASPGVMAAFQRLFNRGAPSGGSGAGSDDEQAMSMRPKAANAGQDIMLPRDNGALAHKVAQFKQMGYSDAQAMQLAQSNASKLAQALSK